MPRPNTRRTGSLSVSVLLASAIVPLAAAVAPSGVASAATAPQNTFTVTGALKGKLVVKPQIDCEAMSPTAESFGWLSSKLSPYGPIEWTIVFQFPRYGTWKSGITTTSVMVTGAGHGVWLATSGTFTTKANAGTVNVTLAGHELGSKGTVHLAGSWQCG